MDDMTRQIQYLFEIPDDMELLPLDWSKLPEPPAEVDGGFVDAPEIQIDGSVGMRRLPNGEVR